LEIGGIDVQPGADPEDVATGAKGDTWGRGTEGTSGIEASKAPRRGMVWGGGLPQGKY